MSVDLPSRVAERWRQTEEYLADPVLGGYAGKPLGFIETSTRVDYVNGTSTSPVGFIEGLYVIDAARFQGIGRMLVQAGERWARERGCREMASEALIGNESSHAAHLSLGFHETERVVYFRKDL